MKNRGIGPRSRRLTVPVGIAALAAPILLGLLAPWRSAGFGALVGLASLLCFAIAVIWWDSDPAAARLPRRIVQPVARPPAPLTDEEAETLYAQAYARYDDPRDMPAWLRRDEKTPSADYLVSPSSAYWREIYRRERAERVVAGSGPTGALGLFLAFVAMILVGGFLLTILLPLGPFGWMVLFFLGLPLIAAIGAAGV